MPDPSMVQWADGTLHHPAGGVSPERLADAADPVLSDLTGDARLPQAADTAVKRMDLAANTAAKMMRAAHQAQTALNRARLFECYDDNGQIVQPDRLTSRDGVALQILKRLARQVEKLETTPLDEDQGETELERGVRIASVLSQMTKQQAVMEQSITKAVGMSTRASQEAAKLSFQMQAHRDKMALAEGGMSAAEVERIADG